MKQLNKSGFAAVEAILIVVIVGIIAGTGYFVWHAKQATEKSLTDTASSQPAIAEKTTQTTKTTVNTSATAHDVLVIKEWGVKLGFKGAASVTYTISATPSADGSTTADLRLLPTVTTIADCQDLQTALVRSSVSTGSTHVVGSYSYKIAGDPSPCSDPSGDTGTISKQRDAILYELGNSNYTVEKN